jgi:4-hydroxy-3-polyprenylbenzoate decarboxylase
MNRKRLIVGISGASGAILGVRTLQLLKEANIETHLVVSPAAEQTLAQETDWKLETVASLANTFYPSDDISASIASGSYYTDGMLIVPCSIKTLSAIANSFNHNLIVRAADVCLKEGHPVLLAVRETPLHRGHTRLLDLAAQAGAIIFPPVPAFYGEARSLDDIVTQIVGRMLFRLGIENNAYHQWTRD